MSKLIFFFCCLFLFIVDVSSSSSSSWWAPLPTAADFAAIHRMESAEHDSVAARQSPRRQSTQPDAGATARIGATILRRRVAQGVNGTVLAEIIYTWTQPTYRQFNFPLTARPANDSVLGALDHLSATHCQPLGGRNVRLERHHCAASAGSARCAARAGLGQRRRRDSHAAVRAEQLAPESYSDPTSPPVLYRGGARNAAWYCNQYSLDFDLSIDQCIAKYFNPRSRLSVSAFWSTTPDPTVTQHYRGSVLYYILPDPTTRTSWHVRNITQINIDPSAEEHLYPAFSQFTVLNVSCVGQPPYGYWNITLLEGGPGKSTTPSKPSGTRPFQRCTA
jgi:hypothetical protein